MSNKQQIMVAIGVIVVPFVVVVIMVLCGFEFPSGSPSPPPNAGYQLPNAGYRPSYSQGDAFDQSAERTIQNLRDAGTYTPQAAENIRNMSRIGRELQEKQRREMP